jgi:PAS domain S-box-containing protein
MSANLENLERKPRAIDSRTTLLLLMAHFLLYTPQRKDRREEKRTTGMQTDTYDRLCRQIVEGTQEAIIFADRDGMIRLWNGGAEAMFGYQAEEAIGQSLDLIIPARLRGRHWEGYRKVMATGVTRYGRELLAVPALRKDGARISLEFTIVMLRNDRGELIGTAALIRDVTTRWQEERVLKERLAGLQAKVASLSKPLTKDNAEPRA